MARIGVRQLGPSGIGPGTFGTPQFAGVDVEEERDGRRGPGLDGDLLLEEGRAVLPARIEADDDPPLSVPFVLDHDHAFHRPGAVTYQDPGDGELGDDLQIDAAKEAAVQPPIVVIGGEQMALDASPRTAAQFDHDFVFFAGDGPRGDVEGEGRIRAPVVARPLAVDVNGRLVGGAEKDQAKSGGVCQAGQVEMLFVPSGSLKGLKIRLQIPDVGHLDRPPSRCGGGGEGAKGPLAVQRERDAVGIGFIHRRKEQVPDGRTERAPRVRRPCALPSRPVPEEKRRQGQLAPVHDDTPLAASSKVIRTKRAPAHGDSSFGSQGAGDATSPRFGGVDGSPGCALDAVTPAPRRAA